MLFSRAADSKEGGGKNNDQENWNISELQYDDEDSEQLSPSVVQTEAKEMDSESENKSVFSPVPILQKTDSSGKCKLIIKDYKEKVIAGEENNLLKEIDLGDTSVGSLSPPVVPARGGSDSRTECHVQRTNNRTKCDKMKLKDDYSNASSAKSIYSKSGRSQLHDCPNNRVFQDSCKSVDADMQMDIECVGIDMSPPAGVAYPRNPAAKVPGETAKRTIADNIKKEPSQKRIKAVCGNKINEQDKTSNARTPQKKSDSSASGLSDIGEVSPDVVSVKRSNHARYECKVKESTPKQSGTKEGVKSFNRAKTDATVVSKMLIPVTSKNLMTHSVSISPPVACSEAETLEGKCEEIQGSGVNKNSMKNCEISIVNEIISEIVNSVIHENHPRTQKHCIVRKADDALSPASYVPRSPAKNIPKAARRLKSRIRVSGVKMKKNGFQENISEKPTNKGCLVVEKVSGKQDSEKCRKLNRDDQIKDDYRNNNNEISGVVNVLPSKLDDDRRKDFANLEKESGNASLECCEDPSVKGEELLYFKGFSESCEKASVNDLKRDICNNRMIDVEKPVENASMKEGGEKKFLSVQRASQEAIIERKTCDATACQRKICRTEYENMEEKVVAAETAELQPDNDSFCKKTSYSSVDDVLDVLMFGKKCSDGNVWLDGGNGQQGMDLVERCIANDADQYSRVVEGCSKKGSYLMHQDLAEKEKDKGPEIVDCQRENDMQLEIGFCKKLTSANDLENQQVTPAYKNDNDNQTTMNEQQMKTAKEESLGCIPEEIEKRTSAKNFPIPGEPISNVTENDVVEECPDDKMEIKDFEYPTSNRSLCIQNEASSSVQNKEISFCNNDNGSVELRSLVTFEDSTKPSCSDQLYTADSTATDVCDKNGEVDINISMTDSLLSDKDEGGLEAYGAEESAPEEKGGSFENDEDGIIRLVNSTFSLDDFTQLREELSIAPVSSTDKFISTLGKRICVSQRALQSTIKKIETKSKGENEQNRVPTVEATSTAFEGKAEATNNALEDVGMEPEAFVKGSSIRGGESTFCGFSTASGRKVSVSVTALEAAKKKLESDTKEKDVPDRVSSDRAAPPSLDEVRIQTDARGTEEGLLQLVNSSFDIDEFTQLRDEDINRHASSFNGFCTASGKKVNVSDKALEAARKKLESDAKEQDIPDKVSSFNGFSTASGKKVNVSDKALEAARKKLESDGKEQDVPDKVSSFNGFSTASGKKVNVSGKALETARKKLESDGKEQDVPDKVSSFNGFSTASGKKVNVSGKALETARKKLESDGKEQDVPDKVSSFNGFSTASGKKVNVSGKALETARKKLESDGKEQDVPDKVSSFNGFSTASGKKVNVSDKALEAARKKLESDGKEHDVPDKVSSFNGFSTASGKKVNVSGKALETARKKLESDGKEQDVPDKVSSFNGFSTASGKKVNVSDKALEAARKKLESDGKEQDVPDKVSSFNGFSTASGKKVNVSGKALETARKKLESDGKEQDVPDNVSSFNGFSTASGKKVNVSGKALETARKKLESDGKEQDVPDNVSSFNGFSTASGKKVNVSGKALETARKKLESDGKEQDVPDKVSSFNGFSTASGKKSNVSDKALEAARKKLESDGKEQDVPDKVSSFNGFSTASGKKVNVSGKALETARKKLESDGKEQDVPDNISSFNGFSTASGKKVNVSDKALEAARKKLESDGKEQDVPDKVSSFNGFSTASGKKVNVSDMALEAARKKLESDGKEQEVPDKVSSFNGFSTASGKKVNVSGKALETARKKLESDGKEQDVPDNVSSFNGFSTASGKKVNVSGKALETARKKLESDGKEQDVRDNVSSFNGFSTASGKKVNVSGKALETARKKLESDGKEQDVPDKVSSFNGFSTASGKKVNVSGKALETARKKLESDGKEQDVPDKVSSFNGFSTASGKKVNVSGKALETARKKLESDGKEQDVPDNVSSFNGFSTAFGKKVNVSDKALEAARKKLESDGKEQDVPYKASSSNGFSTASGRKVNVSDKALEAARKKLESDSKMEEVLEKVSSFVGSALGRKVSVLDDALEAAKKKQGAKDFDSNKIDEFPSFDRVSIKNNTKATEDGLLQLVNSSFNIDEFTQLRDEDINRHASSFNGFFTASGKKVNVSDKALEAARKKLESDAKEQDIPDKVSSFNGFSTASGKKVNVSDMALEAARKKLESDGKEQDVPDKVSSFNGFSTASERKLNVSDKDLEAARKKLESDAKEQDVPDKASSFNGFSTASGRKVTISDKALEAARKKLDADAKEQDVPDKVSSFNGFSTASGRKVNVTDRALEAARKKLESDTKEQDVPDKAFSFNGFSTASGKKASVSDKAVDAVQKKLESNFKEGKLPGNKSGCEGASNVLQKKDEVSDKTFEDIGNRRKKGRIKVDRVISRHCKGENLCVNEENTLLFSDETRMGNTTNRNNLEHSKADDTAMISARKRRSDSPRQIGLNCQPQKDLIVPDDFTIELSERFDEDIEMAMEKDPLLFGKGTAGMTAHMESECSKQKKISGEKDSHSKGQVGIPFN